MKAAFGAAFRENPSAAVAAVAGISAREIRPSRAAFRIIRLPSRVRSLHRRRLFSFENKSKHQAVAAQFSAASQDGVKAPAPVAHFRKCMKTLLVICTVPSGQ